MKKIMLSALAIFAVWTLVDFLLRGDEDGRQWAAVRVVVGLCGRCRYGLRLLRLYADSLRPGIVLVPRVGGRGSPGRPDRSENR